MQTSSNADNVGAREHFVPPQVIQPLVHQVPEWAEFEWLWHGFSTRVGGASTAYATDGGGNAAGELNLGFTAGDSPENVTENRRRLVEAVTGNGETRLLTVRQIHSALSEMVPLHAGDAGEAVPCEGWEPPQADGILTGRQGVLLGIQTADCIPVLVADPQNRAVAAFHAGWRGTVQRVVEQGIEQMRAQFGSDPAELVAAIGPGIGPCCYTVGDEVHGEFRSRFAYGNELFSETKNAADELELRLNLVEANRRQLLAAGVCESSISVVGGCTACHPELYFSHRASGGRAGRMMSVIGIR